MFFLFYLQRWFQSKKCRQPSCFDIWNKKISKNMLMKWNFRTQKELVAIFFFFQLKRKNNKVLKKKKNSFFMGERRGSNPRMMESQSIALPLGYARHRRFKDKKKSFCFCVLYNSIYKSILKNIKQWLSVLVVWKIINFLEKKRYFKKTSNWMCFVLIRMKEKRRATK